MTPATLTLWVFTLYAGELHINQQDVSYADMDGCNRDKIIFLQRISTGHPDVLLADAECKPQDDD